MAAAVAALLVAFAGGYGYHRDELYFVAAGHHLAWGYADQGPLTPLLARAMTEIAPGSLTVLRLPSALAAAATVLLAGGIARELGGSRRAQTLAAACVGVSSLVLFTGHLLSTSTFDLLVWTAVVWLVVRIVRTGEERLWLPAGLVMGVGLLNKPLPAFLGAGLVAGLIIAGPRRMLRSPYLWAGAALALVIWTPWLVWQADHGWPQLDVARSLANGNSTSSQPWWAIVPFQALLASPPLAPVWIAGLVWLARERQLRFLAWAWAVLAVVFMASGGKPYYLGGLLPLLLAAGSVAVDGWLRRGRPRARAAVLGVAIGASAIVNAVIALPLLPARDSDPVVAVNGDVGETIGWPEFARTVARVHRGLPPRTVVFTSNYGEAGAIDRYGPALGIPGAWSGHNAYGQWGPPADGSAPVITVGFDTRGLGAHFAGCTIVAHIDNRQGVDNDERGAPVAVCRAPRRPWSQEWHSLRRLG